MLNVSTYEKRTLGALPGKALTFLRTSAIKIEIRASLFAAGYSEEEQGVGWTLLARASGHVPGLTSFSDDARARAAIAEIDAWDEPGFRRTGAVLERFYPEQHAFVFAGLGPARGAESVLTVSTLLDRLDALESSPEREGTREADQQAVAKLTSRGITPGVRAHLRDLIQIAQMAKAPVLPIASTVEERDAALLELRAWYRDWSETARAVIQRKDYLVMLGLSERRSRRSEEEDEVEVVDEDGGDEPAPAPMASNGSSSSSGVVAP